MSSQENKVNQVLKAFAQRPIAYQRIYAQISGSVTAGLLLSQIVYWWYAVEREFDKTDSELREELAMGYQEFKNAKSKLKKLNLITITIKGVPCRSFYKLQESALLAQISSWCETHQLDGAKHTNKVVRNTPTIPDNTQRLHQRKISQSSKADLSSKQTDQKTGMSLLLSRGVDEKVARSIVFDQHTPLSSIEEAIKNGLAKEAHARKTEGKFRLGPGYIVKSLNQARFEGKTIGPTKQSKELSRQLKNKREAKSYKPLSQEEYKQRVQQQKAKLQLTG